MGIPVWRIRKCADFSVDTDRSTNLAHCGHQTVLGMAEF